jgi:GNAT superfamily N-acetyltransferase
VESTIERDLSRFLTHVKPFLVQQRMKNTMLIATLHFWLTDETPTVEKIGAYVRDADGAMAGVAVSQRGWRVLLSAMSAEATAALEDALAEVDPDTPEVTGHPEIAQLFAERRAARLCRTWRPGTRFGMFQIDEEPIPESLGTGRLMEEDDLPLLTEWLGELYPVENKWRATARARNLLVHGNGYVWEVDSERVAFAGCSGVLWGVAHSGPAYTLPEHRRAGYAGAASRLAIAAARKSGADVVSGWTNLDNPRSQRVQAEMELVDHVRNYAVLPERENP